jgi:hypothetical protein
VIGAIDAAITRKKISRRIGSITLLSKLNIRELALDPSNTLLIRKSVNLERKIATREKIDRRVGNMLLS